MQVENREVGQNTGRSALLVADAGVNLALGAFLLVFPRDAVEYLGLPEVEHRFYVSLFGGVLVGIGIALLLECRRGGVRSVGLGPGGAAAINLCGASVLIVWLLTDSLALSLPGRIGLWALVALVCSLSAIEACACLHRRVQGEQEPFDLLGGSRSQKDVRRDPPGGGCSNLKAHQRDG